jgi:hypothetical protein
LICSIEMISPKCDWTLSSQQHQFASLLFHQTVEFSLYSGGFAQFLLEWWSRWEFFAFSLSLAWLKIRYRYINFIYDINAHSHKRFFLLLTQLSVWIILWPLNINDHLTCFQMNFNRSTHTHTRNLILNAGELIKNFVSFVLTIFFRCLFCVLFCVWILLKLLKHKSVNDIRYFISLHTALIGHSLNVSQAQQQQQNLSY